MVPGQASGAQMLKGNPSGAKVMGLMIFAACRRALLRGTARHICPAVWQVPTFRHEPLSPSRNTNEGLGNKGMSSEYLQLGSG